MTGKTTITVLCPTCHGRVTCRIGRSFAHDGSPRPFARVVTNFCTCPVELAGDGTAEEEDSAFMDRRMWFEARCVAVYRRTEGEGR